MWRHQYQPARHVGGDERLRRKRRRSIIVAMRGSGDGARYATDRLGRAWGRAFASVSLKYSRPGATGVMITCPYGANARGVSSLTGIITQPFRRGDIV